MNGLFKFNSAAGRVIYTSLPKALSVKYERLGPLELGVGDTVVTAKGSFVVTEHLGQSVRVVWLESQRRDTIWLGDGVYGPVEVLRAPR